MVSISKIFLPSARDDGLKQHPPKKFKKSKWCTCGYSTAIVTKYQCVKVCFLKIDLPTREWAYQNNMVYLRKPKDLNFVLLPKYGLIMNEVHKCGRGQYGVIFFGHSMNIWSQLWCFLRLIAIPFNFLFTIKQLSNEIKDILELNCGTKLTWGKLSHTKFVRLSHTEFVICILKQVFTRTLYFGQEILVCMGL